MMTNTSENKPEHQTRSQSDHAATASLGRATARSANEQIVLARSLDIS